MIRVFFFLFISICFKGTYSWNFFRPIQSHPVLKIQPRILYKRSLNESESATFKSALDISLSIPVTTEMISTQEIVGKETSTHRYTGTGTFIPISLPKAKENLLKVDVEFQNDLITNSNKKSEVSFSTTVTEDFNRQTDHRFKHSTIVENVTESLINSSRSTPLAADDPSIAETPSHYIIITISIFGIIGIICYVFYHFYQKEQVRRLRVQLMPVYNFDPTEPDDWESNLLEEDVSLRPSTKNLTAVVAAPSDPIRQRASVPVTYL